MYGYIYITTNLINGHKYIGQHKSSKFDSKYIGSGKRLLYAVFKYGRENFITELVEAFNSAQELNNAEIYYINKYNAVEDPNFYNIARGGQGCDAYLGKNSQEIKLKLSRALSERWQNEQYRETMKAAITKVWDTRRDEMRKKISESLTGVYKSESHKKAISDSVKKSGCHKGSKNGMYGVKRLGNECPVFGRHYYNNGMVEHLLYEWDYELNYRDKGYQKGRLKNRLDTLHKDLSKRLKGNTYNKGKIRITNGIEEKLIYPQQFSTYEINGWIKGRKPKSK